MIALNAEFSVRFFKLGKAGMILAVVALFLAITAGAGVAGSANAPVGKFEVVPGGSDTAFLLDTTTGAVWILTHRTLATGREPVAIPYKFIKISPSHGSEFLLELVNPGSTAGGDAKDFSEPGSGGKMEKGR
jgi:hypothetical protein